MKDNIPKYLKDAKRWLINDKSGININTVLIEGDPASKIIGYSEMEKFDIIIIGSRGMGKFKELIVGSVSNKVLHHAKCSVMLVR
jgi:nucleotide-binding universal stress UspA family protein